MKWYWVVMIGVVIGLIFAGLPGALACVIAGFIVNFLATRKVGGE